MVGRDTFCPLVPVLGPLLKNVAVSPSSAVRGGQYDTKYVALELLLLHAAFMADTI